MSKLKILDLAAAASGLVVALLVALSPRLGPRSWSLGFFLLPSALASAALGFVGMAAGWTEEAAFSAAFALLLLAAPGGLFASFTLARPGGPRRLGDWRWVVAASLVAAFSLGLLHWRTTVQSLPGGTLPGPGQVIEYIAGFFLLAVSVLVLANLERTLRAAEEHVRWEVKFALLGLAVAHASKVYVASRLLLHPGASSDSIQVFPPLLLVTSILIFASWRRGSGRGGVSVSQSLAYSSLTFLGVGFYLIVASLLSGWAGRILGAGFEVEVVVFLLAALVLGVVISSAGMRHRLRHWIRRNLYGGRYDYRAFWLQAVERIRDSDVPELAAGAFADIIHRALGSLDVSVWRCDPATGALCRLAALGPVGGSAAVKIDGVVAALEDVQDVVAVRGPQGEALNAAARGFLEGTGAELVVPLRSGDELVGVATVGPDRSGQSFDWEAREFLGVLARHVAGEIHKRELLAARVKAKEDEAFRAFSTFLLHDLKNFASTLSLIAQNAVKHEANPEFRRDAFRSVFETAERIKRMCNSLRTFAGESASPREPGDLNRVVRGVVEGFDNTLKDHLQLDLGSLPEVLFDREELGRVVQNLLLNASEAISPQGQIRLSTRTVNGGVEISLEDDGVGIPRQFLEQELFMPFRTTKSGGLGIGLFHSRRIVEAHGGTISVESEEGKGTTVRIRLPAAPAAAEAERGGSGLGAGSEY
jgi:putative PEP-CTERM system histidine kinase